MRSESDPLTEDPAELDARADEEAREQRWAEFVLDVVRWGIVRTLSQAFILYECHSRGSTLPYDSPVHGFLIEFAGTEGWPAVLQAIARAMREQAASNGD